MVLRPRRNFPRLDRFLSGKRLTANQIQFVNLVIDSLTQSGWIRPEQLQF